MIDFFVWDIIMGTMATPGSILGKGRGGGLLKIVKYRMMNRWKIFVGYHVGEPG